MSHTAARSKIRNAKALIRSADRLPAHWDNTTSDLSEMKATAAEIARRKTSHLSKNQLVAKIELQRRALNSAVKSAKKPLPAVFVREVLPKPENVCSEVTDLSPQALQICADRILERSARLTAPSVCSSSGDLHNVNPSVTKMPENGNGNLNESGHSDGQSSSKMLPVQITPMVRSRLDRLAEAVTAPVALNEPSLLAESERKQTASSLSSESKATSSNKPNGVPASSVSSSVQESEPVSTKQPKPEAKWARLPEKAAVLEELFSALQVDAIDAGLLAKPAENVDGDDASSLSSHSTLSGHTALLVRVLIGLVSRIRQLETQLSEMKQEGSSSSTHASSVNLLTEKVALIDKKIDAFQDELRQTSGVTTESLQRIRCELENICISNKTPPSVAPNGSTQNVNIPPVMDQELDDFGDEFDCEPWLNPVQVEKKAAQAEFDDKNANKNNSIENIENRAGNTSDSSANNSATKNLPARVSISPPPSSIHFPSGESVSSSAMFGDRLGTQLAELTRQHEQARARLQAMQRSVHSMNRFGVKP